MFPLLAINPFYDVDLVAVIKFFAALLVLYFITVYGPSQLAGNALLFPSFLIFTMGFPSSNPTNFSLPFCAT
jgi:hypothetical protein